MVDFVKELQDGDLKNVKGLSYTENGRVFHNPNCGQIQDLDKINIPALDLIPKEVINKTKSIKLFTTRGCPNTCVYCSTPAIWERKVRFRSVDNIMKEIMAYEDRFVFEEIHFLDDTFTISQKRLEEFCERFIQSRLNNKYSWRCLSRVNAVNTEILSFMKLAGCSQISYGIESGSPAILKRIRKNITLKQAEKAVQLTKKAGIKTKAFFMIGFPYETKEDIEATIRFAVNLPVDDIAINIVKAYPGTEMYEDAVSLGHQIPSFTQIPSLNTKNSVEMHMRKYGSIPEKSCCPDATLNELLIYAKQGYNTFLNRRCQT